MPPTTGIYCRYSMKSSTGIPAHSQRHGTPPAGYVHGASSFRVSPAESRARQVRPPHNHGCKPIEIVPGLWTAHFHDIEDLEHLRTACPGVTNVINAGPDKCHTASGSYGPDVTVLVVDILDDPDALKKVDAMPEGPEKRAAKASLPEFAPHECAGDAKLHFAAVNASIDATIAAGSASVVHCYASLSRSSVFILAYLMSSRRMSLKEAIAFVRPKWDATWPNDTFLRQLVEYERELFA